MPILSKRSARSPPSSSASCSRPARDATGERLIRAHAEPTPGPAEKAHRLAPRFIDSAAGRIHLVEWIPQRPAPHGPVVLMLPPFAEEMNRSRRMLACQARSLAALGIGAVTFDLSGSGDSEGDFGDADWSTWLADARAATEHVRGRGARSLGLLALRSGALLAMDLLRDGKDRFAHAVFWSPVIEGRSIVRQLLRLHAASFMNARGDATAPRSLEDRLLAGESVEIAGYTINPALVRTLQQLHLRELATAQPPAIDWIDVVAAANQPASPASARCVEQLVAAGATIRLTAVHDEPFWSLPEITTAPRLAALTTDLVDSALNPRDH